MLLFNAVVLSVIVMLALSIARVHVVISLFVASLEGDHRAGYTHSGHQAAHQRGDEKRDNDVHACDAENQHDDHGEHDCVEKQHECSCVEGARKRQIRGR